jgi:hypothetical protein
MYSVSPKFDTCIAANNCAFNNQSQMAEDLLQRRGGYDKQAAQLHIYASFITCCLSPFVFVQPKHVFIMFLQCVYTKTTQVLITSVFLSPPAPPHASKATKAQQHTINTCHPVHALLHQSRPDTNAFIFSRSFPTLHRFLFVLTFLRVFLEHLVHPLLRLLILLSSPPCCAARTCPAIPPEACGRRGSNPNAPKLHLFLL